MADSFWEGSLVRLTRESGEVLAQKYAGWYVNSELWRLMDSGISHPRSVRYHKELQEKWLKEPEGNSFFLTSIPWQMIV